MIVWYLILVFTLDHGHATRQPNWFADQGKCDHEADRLMHGPDGFTDSVDVAAAYCVPMKVKP